MTAPKRPVLTTEEWTRRELAKAPALTEQQSADLRRVLLPTTRKKPA